MSLGFYRAFEERFRGPREDIKKRLEVYLPFIKPLTAVYDNCLAIDLGCGRGEWLELLGENDFVAEGVDLDEGMLSACQELGLKVRLDDALGFLKELPDESQVIVSGFHLAEHIPFTDLKQLVNESLRVLKPAGVLILETPNPENLVVGTSSFYLDPTHNRPLPPQLLAFLPEFYGYDRTKVVRLQESVAAQSSNVSLLTVLNGVSPDYAIVAQKTGPRSAFDLLDHAFGVDYGVTLEQLAMAYKERDIDPLRKEVLDIRDMIDRDQDRSKRAAHQLELTGQRFQKMLVKQRKLDRAHMQQELAKFRTLLDKEREQSNLSEHRAELFEVKFLKAEIEVDLIKEKLQQTSFEYDEFRRVSSLSVDELTGRLEEAIDTNARQLSELTKLREESDYVKGLSQTLVRQLDYYRFTLKHYRAKPFVGFVAYIKNKFRRGSVAASSAFHKMAFVALSSSPVFDAKYYLSINPDVRESNQNPLEHYINYGAYEGRKPCEHFDTDFYLRANRDVLESGVNPLYHFLVTGWKENRNPSDGFIVGFYLNCYPDVANSGMNPLLHYMLYGEAEGRQIRPKPVDLVELIVTEDLSFQDELSLLSISAQRIYFNLTSMWESKGSFR